MVQDGSGQLFFKVNRLRQWTWSWLDSIYRGYDYVSEDYVPFSAHPRIAKDFARLEGGNWVPGASADVAATHAAFTRLGAGVSRAIDQKAAWAGPAGSAIRGMRYHAAMEDSGEASALGTAHYMFADASGGLAILEGLTGEGVHVGYDGFATYEMTTTQRVLSTAGGILQALPAAPLARGLQRNMTPIPASQGLAESVGIVNDVATLKAIRRHGERLVRGDVTSSNPATMLDVRNIRAAIANGDFHAAGTGFHRLNFRLVRDAQNRGFLDGLLRNRRLATPGGVKSYRIPDYRYGADTFDLKPWRPTRNAFDVTEQFLDIQGATGRMPIPLYYRLW
jgi:hypothetical protein